MCFRYVKNDRHNNATVVLFRLTRDNPGRAKRLEKRIELRNYVTRSGRVGHGGTGSYRSGRSGRTGGTCRACGAGRACGSGGAGHGDQIKVRRGARRPGSAAAVGAVEGTVVVDQCAQVIRYPGNELCDIIQPFTGRAGGTCGADRTGRTGRSSGTRGSGSARCARGTRSPGGSRGPGRSNGAGRAVGGT